MMLGLILIVFLWLAVLVMLWAIVNTEKDTYTEDELIYAMQTARCNETFESTPDEMEQLLGLMGDFDDNWRN